MNMILHHSATADIAKGGSSTLSNPLFIKNGMLQTFDYVVANPPFSLKNWTDGLSIDPKSKSLTIVSIVLKTARPLKKMAILLFYSTSSNP